MSEIFFPYRFKFSFFRLSQDQNNSSEIQRICMNLLFAIDFHENENSTLNTVNISSQDSPEVNFSLVS